VNEHLRGDLKTGLRALPAIAAVGLVAFAWIVFVNLRVERRIVFENIAFYVLLVVCFGLVVTIFNKLEGREDKQDWEASKIFAAKRCVLWLTATVLAMSVLWGASSSNQTIVDYRNWRDGVIEGAIRGSSGGGCGVVVRRYFDSLAYDQYEEAQQRKETEVPDPE
jgi:hypothetical protein